jgi:flagellar biosynthesis protein FlhF
MSTQTLRDRLEAEFGIDLSTPATTPMPFAAAAYAKEDGKPKRDPVDTLREEMRIEMRNMRIALSQAQASEGSVRFDELSELRHLVEGLSAAGKVDAVARAVARIGVEGTVAASLIQALRSGEGEGDSVAERLRDVIGGYLRVAPSPIEKLGRIIVAAVGPAGVGKTTTIAKLAAHAQLAGRSVSLVTCDTYRVGASEQMSRFAQLLDVSCELASSAAELESILAKAQSDIVFVDTSGRPPKASSTENALVKYATPGRERHVLLCVPASVRAADASLIARTYGRLRIESIAVTKIDETTHPAGILHVLGATDRPVSITCAGPRVPEDISPATRGGLLDAVAPRKRSSRS